MVKGRENGGGEEERNREMEGGRGRGGRERERERDKVREGEREESHQICTYIAEWVHTMSLIFVIPLPPDSK